MKKAIKSNYPFVIFSAGIVLFVLFFTRFFLKTDDGNFLGIALAEDFNYKGFLADRYNNISGRTINEFLVMFFCRHNIILWKLFVSAQLIFISYFFIKLSSYFDGEFSKIQRQTFCAFSFFIMMVSCLNPSVFWFAGSFTYLLPFWGLTAVAFPFLIYIYEKRLSIPFVIIGITGSIAAASQEQGAVCSVALIIILIIASKIKGNGFKLVFLVLLIISFHLLVYLFTSPGMAKRSEMEAGGFERYTEFSLGEKLFCGISAFFANSFYLSIVLILLLTALMSAMLYSLDETKRRGKKLLICTNATAVFICVFVNVVCCASGKGLSHMLIRKAFLTGDFSWQTKVLVAFGFLLLVMLIVLSIMLFIKNKEVGFPVLLCLCAGFGCAMMMSFSSSIFASGQRVYFLTNMFIITACVILLSSVKKTKLTDFSYKASVFYGCATAVLEVFAFTFFEHPLMG